VNLVFNVCLQPSKHQSLRDNELIRAEQHTCSVQPEPDSDFTTPEGMIKILIMMTEEIYETLVSK
jgi:hypothetical protein